MSDAALTRLLDYGIVGIVLVLILVGLAYLIRWTLGQFQGGGLFGRWIETSIETTAKVGEAIPKIVDLQSQMKDMLGSHNRDCESAHHRLERIEESLENLRRAGLEACDTAEAVCQRLKVGEFVQDCLNRVRYALKNHR